MMINNVTENGEVKLPPKYKICLQRGDLVIENTYYLSSPLKAFHQVLELIDTLIDNVLKRDVSYCKSHYHVDVYRDDKYYFSTDINNKIFRCDDDLLVD